VPQHRALLLGLAVTVGFLLTVIWSAQFVDDTIGDNVTGFILGEGTEAPAAGFLAGAAFALVSGLAGTFTACNVAALSAMGPLLGTGARMRDRLRLALTPLARLSAGMLSVSALYGALVGVFGTSMPQFGTAQSVPGTVSPRMLQAMTVYGVIGIIMLYLGVAALRLVPDPFARISRRFPSAPTVFMGMLIGAFLIGRPFSLFRALFRDAANRHDPLFGAVVFALQSIGNILVLSALFLLLTLVLGGRAGRALANRPDRVAAITAVGFVAAGVFLLLYWDVRLLAVRDIIPWYPLAPWV
jgi:hypothetical protein